MEKIVAFHPWALPEGGSSLDFLSGSLNVKVVQFWHYGSILYWKIQQQWLKKWEMHFETLRAFKSWHFSVGWHQHMHNLLLRWLILLSLKICNISSCIFSLSISSLSLSFLDVFWYSCFLTGIYIKACVFPTWSFILDRAFSQPDWRAMALGGWLHVTV